MINCDNNTNSAKLSRRALAAAVLGGAILAGSVNRAVAQTSSSVDTVPMQLLANLHYVSVNYTQTGFYADGGAGRKLGADMIRGGELKDQPGVPAIGARPTSFSTPSRLRLNEIVDQQWTRLSVIRGFLRAEAPAQKLVDLSPSVFTTMFRLAGAIDATAIFDPYANEGNYVLGLLALTDFYPSVARGMAPLFTNDIVRAWLGAFAAGAGSDAANLRALLQDLAASRPELLTMADLVTAWQDRISGLSGVDRRVSPSGTGSSASANLSALDSDGLFPARTAQQALNIEFMTAAGVSQGGFFPNGINGNIRASASN